MTSEMIAEIGLDALERLELELTDHGYLHVPANLAQRFFPEDVLAPVMRGAAELWLYPMRGAAGGGLILKQRNAAGDRSVLIWEALPEGTPSGRMPAFWDGQSGALRVALAPRVEPGRRAQTLMPAGGR